MRTPLIRAISIACLSCLLSVPVVHADTRITHRDSDAPADERAEYFLLLLQLALDKTRDKYGDYRLEPSPQPITQERSFVMVSRGKLDVTWGMTSAMRERRTQPIRIPLMKGLLGYRIMLINKKRQAALQAVNTWQALGQYVMIQGNGWPDVDILRANGMHVRTHTNYLGLFKMLEKNRVDFFPRSIGEVWLELDEPHSRSLALKRDLILHYRSPIYFFVPPEQDKLATRIRTGLERAIADGSFNRLFFSRPELQKALHFLQHERYQLLHFDTPGLHQKTPLNRRELWFTPRNIKDSAQQAPDGTSQ